MTATDDDPTLRTDRTRVRRKAERGADDRAAVDLFPNRDHVRRS